jgi:GNAT superfamily N-acetyltransferase
MTVEVRLLEPEHADDETLVDELAHIVNDAYAVGEAGLWLEGTTRTTPAEIADAIRSDGLLAATLDGRLVGCAYVRRLDAETADLGLISTATDQWGGGVGARVVRSAEELMRSRGMTTMQLEVLVPKEWTHPAKEHLRAWYTRLGYRVVRTAPVEQVAARLACRLATPCEFLIFCKPLRKNRRAPSLQKA